MSNIFKSFTVRPIFQILFIEFLIRYHILLLHYSIYWSYAHFGKEYLTCNLKSIQFIGFYPTALKGRRGIVFTHGVRMGGRAGGWAAGKSLSGLYLRNHKV